MNDGALNGTGLIPALGSYPALSQYGINPIAGAGSTTGGAGAIVQGRAGNSGAQWPPVGGAPNYGVTVPSGASWGGGAGTGPSIIPLAGNALIYDPSVEGGMRWGTPYNLSGSALGAPLQQLQNLPNNTAPFICSYIGISTQFPAFTLYYSMSQEDEVLFGPGAGSPFGASFGWWWGTQFNFGNSSHTGNIYFLNTQPYTSGAQGPSLGFTTLAFQLGNIGHTNTTTDFYGIWFSSNNPTATFTNSFGIYMQNIGGATATGIYIAPAGSASGDLGGSSANYGLSIGPALNSFGGNSTPANTIDIQSGVINGKLDTMAYAAAITLNVAAGQVHETLTTSAIGNATINASSGGTAGQWMWVIINNDATASRTITFGTHFRTATTLSPGATSKAATIGFISDGTSWFECGRAVNI